jgi:hypothetical protein
VSVTRASFLLVLSMLVSGRMSACVLPSRGECTSRWSTEETTPAIELRERLALRYLNLPTSAEAAWRYLRTALRLLLERGRDGGLRASAANMWLSKFETFGASCSGSRFLYGNAPSIQRVASP